MLQEFRKARNAGTNISKMTNNGKNNGLIPHGLYRAHSARAKFTKKSQDELRKNSGYSLSISLQFIKNLGKNLRRT